MREISHFYAESCCGGTEGFQHFLAILSDADTQLPFLETRAEVNGLF